MITVLMCNQVSQTFQLYGLTVRLMVWAVNSWSHDLKLPDNNYSGTNRIIKKNRLHDGRTLYQFKP